MERRVNFKKGETAYIVQNNVNVHEVTVIRRSRNLYVIKTNEGKGMQLPAHRLFPTPEGAYGSIPGFDMSTIGGIKAEGYYRNAQIL